MSRRTRGVTRWSLWWLVAACASTPAATDIDTVEQITGLATFQRMDMLAAHNRWRAQVGVPPMAWSDTLAQSSARWAAQLGLGRLCQMEHSETPDVGENLYWASPVRWSNGQTAAQTIDPAFVVDAWGREVADFLPESNTCRPGTRCRHYTQIVWRATREVGCAVRVCSGKDQVWVCQYRPAGNYIGVRPY